MGTFFDRLETLLLGFKNTGLSTFLKVFGASGGVPRAVLRTCHVSILIA